MSRADLPIWREYVANECQRFYNRHTDGETYIWAHTPEAAAVCARLQDQRGSGRAASDEEAAFSGPWHIVRKYVTTEFRQWVEEYLQTERLTLSQFTARQRAVRDEIAFAESADYTLGELETLRRLTGERDALIVEAAKRGAAKTAIARAVGLSRQQIHTIVAAAELAPVTPIRPDVEIAPTVETRMLADGTVVEVF